ncbi:GNAT family N-acetyltransferase [Schumannella luteola]|uniref:GNAT superfamily N-acetyltransferase n=1 Tax=Schumannella luteola TaxID=472059 RepID=A0A852YHK4_9MICO|nr:GNAT family N-acetyltransferase [Schumannella luteola]NYG99347.1 GNAT superfamily N-acetyltransferase [Schumannella luteola]TPX06077.1 GNAT family N-acetyltransferase [Schumannella luteola]
MSITASETSALLVHTTPDDPRSQPVLADLEREYDTRYRGYFPDNQPASTEINRYPASEFSAPHGTFLLLLDGDSDAGGTAISAGAFKRLDAETVELKRIWTHADHRGRGLARVVMRELEAEAERRGHRRVVLSTGPRQPEAVRLYLGLGYTPLFDVDADPETVGIHSFEKNLETRA